ncbi:MAG TPA: sulfite exporter TauE/SafE family protein [Euzebyales bacterium]|nr:sulfite exporter TauE/SafE family protein [Euzebyales bacterium]
MRSVLRGRDTGEAQESTALADLGIFGIALLTVAAWLAGAVNAVAGGGSLISFPALLAVGYPAVTANITNTVALCPGYVGGTIGYRRELAGQRGRVVALGLTSAVGAVAGSWLLLVSSPEVFERIVPFLILAACALLALQRQLARVVQRHAGTSPEGLGQALPLHVFQFIGAVYGAYFGAGLGIMMLAVLSIFLADTLQRLNALKGVMSLVINVVGAVYFAIFADVVWFAVAIMATAALIGGRMGVALARRLNDQALRWMVVAFGVAVAIRLMFPY